MSGLVKWSLDPAPGGSLKAWGVAAEQVRRWIERGSRVDRLMEELPEGAGGGDRARSQHLIFGALRHAGRLNAALGGVLRRTPRPAMRAVLLVAGFELIEAGADEGRAAKIVHHAVDRARELASPAEAGMANAALRRLAPLLGNEPAPSEGADPSELARYHSHPEWLVRRWIGRFGAAATLRLLEWNQQPPPVYARLRSGEALPGALAPTQWPRYFRVLPGAWRRLEPLLSSGALYIQDPAAERVVAVLDPRPGERVIDLCAAPGGKTLSIADRLGDSGAASSGSPEIVAVDLPGSRLARLGANLAREREGRVAVVAADLRRDWNGALADRGLPGQYPAVLLDAPCSNTGVMRRRPDVKWRLEESDFGRHAAQQILLLRSAADRVAEGGRIAYATCSIDSEENEEVVAKFLGEYAGRFRLEARDIALPWEAGHDGAGAFLLRRTR